MIYDSIRFYADNAQIFKDDKILKLEGNARAIDDTLEAGADKAVYNYEGKILNLKDNAYLLESSADSVSKKVIADELSYYRLKKTVEAKGDIVASDFVKKVILECGDFNYDSEQDYGSAKVDPVLKFRDKQKMTIRSKQMEIFAGEKKITATYDVNVEMKNSFAKGKFLIYFNQDEKAVLLGDPHFESKTADALAHEFEMYFVEDKIDSLFMTKNAKIYFNRNDSDNKTNFLFAKRIKLDFEDEKIKYMLADLVEKSLIKEMNTDKIDFYINELSTDNLKVYFDNSEKIEKVIAEQDIEGVYRFEQKE